MSANKKYKNQLKEEQRKQRHSDNRLHEKKRIMGNDKRRNQDRETINEIEKEIKQLKEMNESTNADIELLLQMKFVIFFSLFPEFTIYIYSSLGVIVLETIVYNYYSLY